VLAVSVLPFVIAELALRLIYPDKVTKLERSQPEEMPYEFNEDYLVSLRSNVTDTLVRDDENGGDVIHWQTNSDSFRGPDLASDPGYRIIVYGDSNIQARFSSYENSYVYKLGEYLKEGGIKDLEVINAGIVGFGPDQSLIRFEKEADIYKPDLVIFHIFPDNDFGDLIRNRLYELDEQGNLSRTKFAAIPDECLTAETNHNLTDFLSSLLIVKATRKFLRLFERRDNRKESRITGKDTPLKDKVAELEEWTEKEYSVYKKSQPRKFSHCEDHYDIDIAMDPDKESSRVKLQLMGAVLRAASSFAKSKDIGFLVVIQPSVIDMTKHNAGLGYEYLQNYREYKSSNLTDAVKYLCVENNIPFVDLADVFLSNNPEDLFFKGPQAHWNDLGQDIAAQEAALYISEKIMSK
jgi:hypothetical protein